MQSLIIWFRWTYYNEDKEKSRRSHRGKSLDSISENRKTEIVYMICQFFGGPNLFDYYSETAACISSQSQSAV